MSVVNCHAGARSSGHMTQVKHSRGGYSGGGWGWGWRPGAVTEHKGIFSINSQIKGNNTGLQAIYRSTLS